MSESRDAILKDRFYHAHEKDWYDVAERVARSWAKTPEEVAEFYEMLRDLKALPNTPAIANAGRSNQMGSACYVLPINDSLTEGPASIMQTLKDAAAVHKSGGGTGFSFRRIRGRGTSVSSTGRPAPGAVNVLELYSDAIARVTQAGMRPGANMGILPCDHPDIMEFLSCKGTEGRITNFNISVALTDDFMRDIEHYTKRHTLGDIQRTLKNVEVWDRIVDGAWNNGEPGVLFIDTVNNTRLHPEEFEATNPCGEVPLRPYEACVLGSVDVSKHLMITADDGYEHTYEVDWDALSKTIRTMARFLDNVIDLQDYPIAEIEREQKRYRKIGIGPMGFADACVMLGIRYGSDECVEFARELAEFFRDAAYDASEELADQRGPYPGFNQRIEEQGGMTMPYRRNLCCLVVAPTGTISRLAGCSFGIEPHPDVNEHGYYKSFVVGGVFDDHCVHHSSEFFVPTSDVPIEGHLRVQAAWQEFYDQAVSKTINCPHETSKEDVARAIIQAWKLGIKGTTFLRAGARSDVVLGASDCVGAACSIEPTAPTQAAA
jgi:ribonucleoside-diphosphate reductase alpha chain